MKKYKIGSTEQFSIAHAANMELNVSETRTVVSIAMAGNGILKLSADAKPSPGDEVILKVGSDGTARTLTFGDGFTVPALAGVISKTKVQALVYDGTEFVASAAPVQID